MLFRSLSIAVGAVLLATVQADAHQYKPRITNCRASLEDFIKHDGAGGQKILHDHGGVGAIREFTMRWSSGTIERVTVAPSIDPKTGQPAVCVIAAQFIRTDISS